MGSPVHLYIYDLSRGLAKTLSMTMLGKEIEAIYHTSIVVYGREYFYGGDGVSYCPPQTTMLGAPMEITKLGDTELPLDLIDEHCQELTQGDFRPSKYRLFEHNCNNFSDEFAEFLVGTGIPAKITGLPNEVLQTPLGQTLKGMLENMDISPMGQNGAQHHFR